MKYKNISGFRQSIFINGKRVILEPDQVIESNRELKYIFLDKVDDNTPAEKLEQLQSENKLIDLQQKLEEISKHKFSVSDIDAIKQHIKHLEDKIQHIYQKIQELEIEQKQHIFRKMEMLKSAIMTLQEDVYNIKFDENGKIISE